MIALETRKLHFIWIILAILFQTVAMLCSKQAALLGRDSSLFASIFTFWYATSLFCLVMQAIVWTLALRTFSLSFAYPFMSTVRGFVIFGAWYFFGETIRLHEILGILLIMSGIAVLGGSKEK